MRICFNKPCLCRWRGEVTPQLSWGSKLMFLTEWNPSFGTNPDIGIDFQGKQDGGSRARARSCLQYSASRLSAGRTCRNVVSRGAMFFALIESFFHWLQSKIELEPFSMCTLCINVHILYLVHYYIVRKCHLIVLEIGWKLITMVKHFQFFLYSDTEKRWSSSSSCSLLNLLIRSIQTNWSYHCTSPAVRCNF